MRAKQWQLQLLRFGVVGTTAAGVYVCAALFLFHVVKMPLDMSSITAFFVSAFLNYVGNAFWSFDKGSNVRSLLKFLVLCFIALPITMFISHWITVTEKPAYYGILITALVIPLISFAVQKLWVFRA